MIEVFGRTEAGEEVSRVTLEGGGLTANVMTWGAVLQDLRLEGHGPALVLGLERFEDYPAHSPYFGALAGRCANRIGGASFELDGQRYDVDPNFLGKHLLHGGRAGCGKRNWVLDGADRNSARLTLRMPDGEMGFPGNLDVAMTVRLLDGGVLDFEIEAVTDAPTLCNFAHHSYFNLDGGATILDHDLQIDADGFLAVDAELIPTGAVAPVEGTAFDFRAGHAVRRGSDTGLLDHNFCLSRQATALRRVARLSSAQSGVAMDIRTTEAGLQVYDGAKLAVVPDGLDGRRMEAHAGIALEPQCWPDAINHADFPQAVLRPGQTYRQHSQFVFTKGA